MEIGKCMTCGIVIGSGSIGYCVACANEYYRKRDKEFPFVVRFGNENEEFATEKEANDFCDELHSAYVERKEYD